jgi:hypothetical protein
MDHIAGHLEVGINDQGEVVINIPKGEVDADGVSHLVFSQNQAISLGELLIRLAQQLGSPIEAAKLKRGISGRFSVRSTK